MLLSKKYFNILMKISNKNINTFGKYFLALLAAFLIYRMVMPVVEGWSLKKQNYDCETVERMVPKKYKLCKDGDYTIAENHDIKTKQYDTIRNQAGPGGCRATCMRDEKCGGFVYDRKRKQCYMHSTGNVKMSNAKYAPGRIVFDKDV